jgi:GxxExxY protein
MEHADITEKIIGCAFKVYNRMGFGFLENVYENCMMIELEKAGLHAETQKEITVFYDEKMVGHFAVDVMVEDLIVVELKSVTRIVQAHEVQLVNYLVATKKPIGLLINFGEFEVEVKRKFNTLIKRHD